MAIINIEKEAQQEIDNGEPLVSTMIVLLSVFKRTRDERDALQSQLEATQRELTASTISWENALAELQKAREQEPVGFVFLDEDAKGCKLKAGIDILGETKVKPGDKLYAAQMPAMPIPSHGDADAAFANYLEGLGGADSYEWHDKPADDVFKDGFAAGQRAMPMQDDRIAKEWQEIWSPIDELVRPLTPLGHSVAVKAVELIKQALAIPIPKQDPAGAVPDPALVKKLQDIWWRSQSAHSMRERTAIEIINTVRESSPRITEQEPAGAVFDGIASLIAAIKQHSNGQVISIPDDIKTEAEFLEWLKSPDANPSPRITEQDDPEYAVLIHKGNQYVGYSQYLKVTDELESIKKAHRVAEQDAWEIISSFVKWVSEKVFTTIQCEPDEIYYARLYMEDEGRALLNKLNEKARD